MKVLHQRSQNKIITEWSNDKILTRYSPVWESCGTDLDIAGSVDKRTRRCNWLPRGPERLLETRPLSRQSIALDWDREKVLSSANGWAERKSLIQHGILTESWKSQSISLYITHLEVSQLVIEPRSKLHTYTTPSILVAILQLIHPVYLIDA